MDGAQDPILAISRSSLANLNTDDVQQVARIWNVFTKCKESVEEGRRFENLSWRLWFRQTHHQPGGLQLRKVSTAQTAQKTPAPCPPLPLSEPELSTDESGCSEDGESDRVASSTSTFESERPRSQNAFTAVIPSPERDASWDERIAHLARNARAKRGQQHLAIPEEARAAVREALLQGSDRTDDSAVTLHASSLSTTGTITPRAVGHRSRANSVHFDEEKRDAPSAATHASAKAAAPPLPASDTPSRPAPAAPAAPNVAECSSETPTPRAHSPTHTQCAPEKRADRAPSMSGVATAQPNGSRPRRGQGSRTHRSHERLAQRGASKGHNATRAQVMQMLAMTHAEPTEEKSKSKSKKKRAAIKFITGSEDGSDEEDAKAPMSKPAQPQEEDEWCEVDEEEEKRIRQAERAAAKQRRREKAERERAEMFKKRPIRSMSMADLSAANKPKEAAAPDAETSLPQRSLLSTIFHAPAETGRGAQSGRRSRPGRVEAGRPRNPMAGKTLSFVGLPQHPTGGTASRNTSTPSYVDLSAARRSSSANAPAMDRSKSAIALPLLNLTSLRSTTGRSTTDVRASGRASVDMQRVPSMASLPSTESPGSLDDEMRLERNKSSTALARLSALAHGRHESHDAKHVPPTRSSSALSSVQSTDSFPHTSSQVSLTPDEYGPSLNVQMDQNEPQDYFNLTRRVPQVESPPSTGHASPRHVRSMTQLPIPTPPPLQSPGTTRQNMLRDELSESLRQNLLWERQSRARLLGIGMPSERNSGTSTPLERRSKSSVGHSSLADMRRYDDQSFHHKGW